MFFKKLKTPVTNETKEVDAVQLWYVRWNSRHGRWRTDTKPEVEAFPSKEEADQFAQALKNAFTIIKHTEDGTKITVTSK